MMKGIMEKAPLACLIIGTFVKMKRGQRSGSPILIGARHQLIECRTASNALGPSLRFLVCFGDSLGPPPPAFVLDHAEGCPFSALDGSRAADGALKPVTHHRQWSILPIRRRRGPHAPPSCREPMHPPIKYDPGYMPPANFRMVLRRCSAAWPPRPCRYHRAVGAFGDQRVAGRAAARVLLPEKGQWHVLAWLPAF